MHKNVRSLLAVVFMITVLALLIELSTRTAYTSGPPTFAQQSKTHIDWTSSAKPNPTP